MNATPAALPNTGAEISLGISQTDAPMKETIDTDGNQTSDTVVSENKTDSIINDTSTDDVTDATKENGQVFIEEYGYLKYIDVDFETVQSMRCMIYASCMGTYPATVIDVSDDGRTVTFTVEGLTTFGFTSTEPTDYQIGEEVKAYALFSFAE